MFKFDTNSRVFNIGLLAVFFVALPIHAAQAAAACVVAKKMGDSLALEWVADAAISAEEAVNQAKEKLRQAGHGKDRYVDLFAQANTDLPHAYTLIVKTSYKNARGKSRTSYGCGFSTVSYSDAQWAALRDLQAYSWGWTPSRGFEVLEQFRF